MKEINEYFYKLYPIGNVVSKKGHFAILVNDDHRDALLGLEQFSHAIIFWWASGCDQTRQRQQTILKNPYTKGTGKVGIFATRSPRRPNPIAITVVSLLSVDENTGNIIVPVIDAEHDPPVIDIKPYFPASDRVETSSIPKQFSHWPKKFEDSAEFDWSKEFIGSA